MSEVGSHMLTGALIGLYVGVNVWLCASVAYLVKRGWRS